MLNGLALIVILLVGGYFIGLAVVALAAPARASHFLLGFAHSAFAHYLELSLRLIVGGALLQRAPLLPFSQAFTLFGWLLVGTTACLLLVPWQWHRRFAQQTLPHALRYLTLIAVVSLALGGFVLVSAIHSIGA